MKKNVTPGIPIEMCGTIRQTQILESGLAVPNVQDGHRRIDVAECSLDEFSVILVSSTRSTETRSSFMA